MKRLAAILFAAVLYGAPAFASTLQANDKGITPELANEVAQIIRGEYQMNTPTDDQFALDPNRDYTTLEGMLGSDPNNEFGSSQRLMVRSLFAFGASMDNAALSSIKNMFSGVPLLKDIDINNTNPKVGLLSGYVIVPVLVRVFATMDIYITNFFGGAMYYVLFLLLIIMMGAALIRQLHEGRLDYVSWLGKVVFAVLCMLKANVLCNYVLAAAIGIAACINGAIVNGMVSQDGLNDWYLRVYGPQLTRNCYAIITGPEKAALATAFSEQRDMYNISRYILFENGSQTATTLAKYLGGSQGYNATAGGTDPQINGTSLKEAASMYCLMTVYNVGMQNLEAHRNMGMDNVDADEAAFKLAIAQIYYNNDGLTAGDQSLIDAAGDTLTIPGGTTTWAYLANNTLDPQAAQWSSWYQQPAVLQLATVAQVAGGRSPTGTGSSLWSTITSWIGKAGAAVYNVVSWLPAKVATFLTQGALQALLLGGMLIWMMLGIALCKLGVILVVMTSPFIMLPNTSKIFWSAVKTMIYPSIYPAMLIVIMQMLGALTSWIGTIAGLTGGMALILSQLPLLFGLVTIIALPKIVKVMLGGGNIFMAQMNVAKGVAMLAAAAATGGIAAVGLGGAAAAGAAAKGAGAAASAAGGAAGGGSGGAPPVIAGGGAVPSGPKERALVSTARSVGRVFGVTDRKSAGKAALWGAIGGAPGLAVFAARSALKDYRERKQAKANET